MELSVGDLDPLVDSLERSLSVLTKGISFTVLLDGGSGTVALKLQVSRVHGKVACNSRSRY